MGSIFKTSMLNCTVGLLLGCCGWLVWWLGSLVLGASFWDQFHTLWLALALGAASALVATFLLSLADRRAIRQLQQHLTSPAGAEQPPCPAWGRVIAAEFHRLHQKMGKQLQEAKEHAKRKRRRHPLDQEKSLAKVTSDLRWAKVSKAMSKLLHVPGEQLLGASIFQSLDSDDVAAVRKAFAEARAKRVVQRILCRLVAWGRPIATGPSPSDTDELPAFQKGLLYVRLDIWAKEDCFVCKIFDLTPMVAPKELELRTTRAALDDAKQRLVSVGQALRRLKLSYRELYQNAPVMYFSMDRAGRLVTFNDTLARTLGYDRHELQGKEYTALLAPATLKSYVTIAESMPSQEGELETQWRKKNGTVIDVWLHSVSVYDEEKKFIRYRSAALDLSEKNRLANELRARGNELERTNQTLRIINGELEAFTHVVSHDLKEPLRTLQAYSHLLAEEHAAQLGPDGFQYINHLVRASRRLGALIDELLKLSQAGRITRAAQAFNLNAIVATVRQDLVDLIQRKGAVLVTEGALPDVVGDPVRVTQLMTNLAANGIKYNRDPQPRVVIGAIPCEDDPGRVTIYVRDNGIGIDPAFHQQVFGIFRRLHQDGEFEGTGAGLAICKKIVEGHGGRIWIDSQAEQGATFFFTLPRPPGVRVASPVNGKPKGQERVPPAPMTPVNQRKTVRQAGVTVGFGPAPSIVLVEDQADVGMIIQKLGKRDGLNITWFPTAEEAWSYLEREQVDLLLLDINLPGMNGLELCKQLRELDHFRRTAVAMFTPVQDAEHLESLRAAGGDFFLTKDLLCQPTEWQRKIQELLQQIRQPASH